MAQDWLWQAFCQTGRVEDYLRYRGAVNAADRAPGQSAQTARADGTAGVNPVHTSGKESAGHAAHHRRPDSAGEQPDR